MCVATGFASWTYLVGTPAMSLKMASTVPGKTLGGMAPTAVTLSATAHASPRWVSYRIFMQNRPSRAKYRTDTDMRYTILLGVLHPHRPPCFSLGEGDSPPPEPRCANYEGLRPSDLPWNTKNTKIPNTFWNRTDRPSAIHSIRASSEIVKIQARVCSVSLRLVER